MKKSKVLAILSAMTLVLMAGCGQDANTQTQPATEQTSDTGSNETTEVNTDNSVDTGSTEDASQSTMTSAYPMADVDTTQYVTLGQYKGLTITVESPKEPTDEEITSYIYSYYASSAIETVEVTDRAAVDGDSVNISYEGRIDGELFDRGSTAEGDTAELVLGSGSYIPGFEDGVVGMKPGETKDITVTFPDEYPTEQAGKEAVFTVTLVSINETIKHELTDELVADLGMGVTTVDELKAQAKAELEAENQEAYESECTNAVFNTVLNDCTFTQNPPAELVAYYKSAYVQQVESYAAMFGISQEEFLLNYYGMTVDQFEEETTSAATSQAQEALVIEAIADAEGLSDVSDADLNAAAEQYINDYGYYESVDAMFEVVSKDEFRDLYVIYNSVVEFLLENNTFVG